VNPWRPARRAAIAYIAAGILVAFGCGFLLLALFVHVARRVGAVEAGLWFGGAFLLLAIVVIVGHRLTAEVRRRSARRQRNRDLSKVAVAASFALAPALLRSRVGWLALAAPLVAAVAYSVYRENAPPADDRPGRDGRRP
jgi:hypothetical protein